MARKQYGVLVEVEVAKRAVGVGRWKWVWRIWGLGAPLAVAESRCLHIFIHSVQRQRLPTTAKLWNALRDGCVLRILVVLPPMYLHFCVSGGSNSAWLCTLLVCPVGLPFKYLRLYLFNISIAYFRTKARAVPSRKDDGPMRSPSFAKSMPTTDLKGLIRMLVGA